LYILILAAVIALSFVFNLVYLTIYCKSLKKDAEFEDWLKEGSVNRFTNAFVLFVSLFTSFKIHRIIYSKFFGFSFFSARILERNKILFKINLLTGISILLCTIPSIVVALKFLSFSELFIRAL
jgi:hypothetical protein